MFALLLVEVGLVMVRPVNLEPPATRPGHLGLLRLHAQTANTDARRIPPRRVRVI